MILHRGRRGDVDGIVTKVPAQKWRESLLLPFTPSLPLSSHLTLSVSGFRPRRMSTSPWPAPIPPFLTPPLSPLPTHPSFSRSRGAAFRLALMALRWCMHSHSRIPSRVKREERRGALCQRKKKKKKDDMWDWETWLDRYDPARWGRRVREGEMYKGAEELDTTSEKADVNKASKHLRSVSQGSNVLFCSEAEAHRGLQRRGQRRRLSEHRVQNKWWTCGALLSKHVQQ